MINFQFYSPTEFVFGKDSELRVAHLLKKHSATKVLFHYGGGSIKRSGLYDRVVNTLKENNIPYVELGGVVPNPRLSLVNEGIKIVKENHIDFILAVGGGSVMDSAKAIAIGTKYDGDLWDLYTGTKIKEALPVGVIVTIPASGSEASNSSVITNDKLGLKKGTNSDLIRPKFAIMNPELTYTIPNYHAFAGVVDMMSHIFERYLTNTPDVDLTDLMQEAVLISIMDNAKRLLKDPRDYNARAHIMWAGTIAHNGILGVGRTTDWASHGLEHELSALYDVSHGAGLAVIFPHYMLYTLDHDVDRYYRLAVNVMKVKPNVNDKRNVAIKGIRKLQAFYKSLGMPLTFDDIGAKKEDIPQLVKQLEINRGSIFGGFVDLTMDDARKIYESCL
ncbi:MAG TPA: iron-containing alcohol dehydrogenase [Acholeplasmataceae bacterium]|nr:iron-containing alcohol dehydrogenase [Acholeplasmataceae bacterium]HQC30112.1 iron-containing alcohol dehydrogenase [Acholeplasmataceae bacterium]